MAASLTTTLAGTHISTDSLARHPGRPWRLSPEKVPDDVAEHYLNLTVDELIEDVLHHYKVNVWPQVENIIASHLGDPTSTGIILEGSAVWPDFASNLDFTNVAAIWLTASNELLQKRIHANSRYTTKSPQEQTLIDKFVERTLAYNARMVEVVDRLGFALVDVRRSNVSELTHMCMSILGIERD